MTTHAAPVAARPRVGVVKFASCDGCQLTLLDLEDELLAVVEHFEIVDFPEATSSRSPGPYDVLFVEGSVSEPAHLERIVELRRQTPLPRHDRRLRHGRRHPGAPQLGRPRRLPGRRLRPPGVDRLAGPLHPDRRARDGGRGAARLPDRSGPAGGAPDGAHDRAPAAAARRVGLHGVQAPRRRLRDGQQGDPLPRPGDPDRLRGDLPALRPRLLRLLRPARAGQRRRARPPPPDGRRPAARGGGTALRRVHRVQRAVPEHGHRARRHADGADRHGGRHGRRRREASDEHGHEEGRGRAPVRGRGAHPGRGRGLAAPARARRRGRRGAPGHLRDAPLLRAARRRADPRRGDRHGGPHLRDLPGRVPDERVARVRGPLRGPDRSLVARAPPPLLLRRVDREPRAPHLPPPRPGLPGLSERDRHGGRPPAARREGAPDEEGRQPPRQDPRRPADPPGQRPRRRLEPRPARRRAQGAPGGAGRRAWRSPRRP